MSSSFLTSIWTYDFRLFASLAFLVLSQFSCLYILVGRRGRRPHAMGSLGQLVRFHAQSMSYAIADLPAKKVCMTCAEGDNTVILAARPTSRLPQLSSMPISREGLCDAAATAILRLASVKSMRFCTPRSRVRTLPASVPSEVQRPLCTSTFISPSM